MKEILLITLLVIANMSFADCGDSYNNNITAGTTGTWSVSEAVTAISDNAGCNKNWNDKIFCRAYIYGTEDYQLGQMFNTGTVSWAAVANRLYQIGGSASAGTSTTISLQIKLDGPNWGWSDHVLDRFFNITVYHCGSINLLPNVFCSGKDYLFDDIVTSPVSHLNKSLVFSTGETFNGTTVNFAQPANNSMTVTYSATCNGYAVARTWTTSIRELRQGYFTDTPSGMSINSNDVDLSLYSFTSPGVLKEYVGNGVYYFGNSWLFSPSSAGNGDHTLSVRVNNQGCYSDYRDTVFSVIGIAPITVPPALDFAQTFGPGEIGESVVRRYAPYLDYEGQPEPGFDQNFSKFHFACSNSDYTFFISNPLSNLTYEWVVYYHNQIYQTGTGSSLDIVTPDRSSVDEDVYYGLQPFPWPDSTNISHLIKGPGDYETNYMGDVLRITVRKKNVINQVSNYSEWFVGVVDKPVLENNERICYVSDPTLVSVSESPVYLSFADQTAFRSMRWDIDMDGDWELAGDSVTYNISNSNKVNLFKAQVVDSTKYWMYSAINNDWQLFSFPSSDQVCFSNIDTVRIVKSPQSNVSFNEIGVVDYGTAIRGVVSGQYFNSTSDSISWQWSDGSGLYHGDTVWHYLNDLGFYSLTVSVVDQYGCSNENIFLANWFVPGTLDVEEEEFSFDAYPVPVETTLNLISNSTIDSWRVFDINGKLVLNGSGVTIDFDNVLQGNYFIEVEIGGNINRKKIVKI